MSVMQPHITKDSTQNGVGLHILRQHIAADAIYDSAARFPAPECHPGTREKVINTILDWVNDPEADKQALWLHGPAGAGKPAIAHSIALLLQEILTGSNYAGSFFFARDAPGRGDGNKLFSTIAYQLALKFPSFRTHLDAAMMDNPTLPTKSIDIQLNSLIIDPLKRVEDWPAHSPTVIIDGLDECAGSKRIQSVILSEINKAIIEHGIPLRFLVVSRPEYWIADFFETGPLSRVTKLVSLRDDLDADKDIEKYLRKEFDKIYQDNILIMSSTPRPWPSNHILERFIREASGQFIYASTVLKFIGGSSNFFDPREQLRILSTPGPHCASAFSELDKLYATVLSAYPRRQSLKSVLGGIMLEYSDTTIQEFLGVKLEEIHLVQRALISLIEIPKQECPDVYQALLPTFGFPEYVSRIRFSHLSFQEFLENPSRSDHYAVDKTAIGTTVLCAMFKLGCDVLQNHPDVDKTISRYMRHFSCEYEPFMHTNIDDT